MTAYRPSIGAQAMALIVAFGVTYATAAVGALASVQARSFYAELVRPEWAPPGWLFGPVWSVLYTLMAIAVWLVWRSENWQAVRLAVGLFAAQLLANALWSWLFFAWRLGSAAFVEVLLLWSLILATMVVFWRVSRLAAALLAPYLAWVTFAAALTLSLWQSNPQLLG
ncbi:tryptophan-rich sensory protein [Permianibacter sp. IMCC34836]|uniref:TspO/MBR family protein n=1 Tax=Permianibacter fluminis TaxID=2738515 RepID=UPI0015576884|nr:TspO/MBR family protein [Permianibacter fluminis]NQD38587.1 tryptophan-rich sensory protein [Permianibacter fluminis]